MPTADEGAGDQIYRLIEELYPICRSITGDGIRETLRIIQRSVPLVMHEVPTGTRVFDWTVPREWNIRDAYVMDSSGRRVVDFHASNLHVVSYSVPVRRRVTRAELCEHLFTIPDQPDRIPYRTSYYAETWGFCLAHSQLERLVDDEYDVCIDSTLEPGHLTYGEYLIPGATTDEVLISTHACHPSLANDNLAGIGVATMLAAQLSSMSLRYSYRFVFIPGTIGSITWLARNESSAGRIAHGLVLSCLGDSGRSTYKRSRRGRATIDRAAEHVLRHSGQDFAIRDFVPYGYDERQYCSPGFDLPVGCLTRTPNGAYPEYHTSADDLALVRPECLADSLAKCLKIIEVLEHNGTYVNLNPKCEPQLGSRGLYRTAGGLVHQPAYELALLWVLNASDGRQTLLDIAERSGLDFGTIRRATEDLITAGLLAKHAPPVERERLTSHAVTSETKSPATRPRR
jgi:aminopeptidase-like protein